METFTDDTVVALASFLSPQDMVSLALACKRFGAKNLGTSRGDARQTLETHNKYNTSLMEVAARTVLHTKWTNGGKKALPRHGDESWIGLYQEFLSVFCLPLQFDKLVGRMQYISNTDKTRVGPNDDDESEYNSTAICNNIMRAGKHCISFQVNNWDPSTNIGVSCGIMRPTTKDITSLAKCHPAHDDLSRFSLTDYEMLHGDNNVDCCLLDTSSGFGIIRKRWKKWKESELMSMNVGKRLWARLQNNNQPWRWEGMEDTQDALSFKIGMVLDLDEGTLDVYKNDRRLGTMKTGLVGEYCWAVSLKSFDLQYSVSISR